MQIKTLLKDFDNLQQQYGDKSLDAICGAGQLNSPNLCLVFMNPTKRNVASNKSWRGLKAPWIGTKNVWKMFNQLGIMDDELYKEIDQKKPEDWDYKFTNKLYKAISDNSIYITNLAKATQSDARPLNNAVFKQYIDLFKKEISIIKPKVIISFGNQVSSIILNENIKVLDHRKKNTPFNIDGKRYKLFPVYYPVGQGMRNIKKAKEDISWILKNYI